MDGKLIICSAPSGAGKSTIINYLLKQDLGLCFSISATSRPPRGAERHGTEYYFLTPGEFRSRIDAGEFLEYEEVYPGRFYGTLKSELERIWEKGRHVILDVDVAGGCRIKAQYGSRALTIFIRPPDVGELRARLERRATESAGAIESRIAKAEYEMSFAPRFDAIIVNDELHKAKREALDMIRTFLRK